MSRCNCCGSKKISEIYSINDMPVFQNKNFLTANEAKNAIRGDIKLLSCLECGFTWNDLFDNSKLVYNEQYENEQGNSKCFQEHLNYIQSLLIEKGFRAKKIIEIGCGKGKFLEQMRSSGFDIVGFDPAYVGDSPHIIKEYFGTQYEHFDVDAVILRHVLEHIPRPKDFLMQLTSILKPSCVLYIEIPDFEWIVNKKAFWDIHYEHCNYFTEEALKKIFDKVETELCFGEQYRYVISSVNDFNMPSAFCSDECLSIGKDLSVLFKDSLDYYKCFLKDCSRVVLWGAGAKATTFLNTIDKSCEHVVNVIDINPKKQGKFIAGTGHPIISPEDIEYNKCKNILIMNENYEKEIRDCLPDTINVSILK